MKLLKLVPDNTNIDFMRWRNVALVLQIVLMVAALTLVAVKGLNLGIDFVGGQVVRTTFAQPINVEQLRDRVNALELGDASIQEFGGPRSYQIRLPKPEGGDAAASRAVATPCRRHPALVTKQEMPQTRRSSGGASGIGAVRRPVPFHCGTSARGPTWTQPTGSPSR